MFGDVCTCVDESRRNRGIFDRTLPVAGGDAQSDVAMTRTWKHRSRGQGRTDSGERDFKTHSLPCCLQGVGWSNGSGCCLRKRQDDLHVHFKKSVRVAVVLSMTSISNCLELALCVDHGHAAANFLFSTSPRCATPNVVIAAVLRLVL